MQIGKCHKSGAFFQNCLDKSQHVGGRAASPAKGDQKNIQYLGVGATLRFF